MQGITTKANPFSSNNSMWIILCFVMNGFYDLCLFYVPVFLSSIVPTHLFFCQVLFCLLIALDGSIKLYISFLDKIYFAF